MDRYSKPVTKYELVHSLAYTLAQLDALKTTVLEFLNLSKEEEKEFLERFNQHIKEREEQTLRPDILKSWVDRLEDDQKPSKDLSKS